MPGNGSTGDSNGEEDKSYEFDLISDSRMPGDQSSSFDLLDSKMPLSEDRTTAPAPTSDSVLKVGQGEDGPVTIRCRLVKDAGRLLLEAWSVLTQTHGDKFRDALEAGWSLWRLELGGSGGNSILAAEPEDTNKENASVEHSGDRAFSDSIDHRHSVVVEYWVQRPAASMVMSKL
ncbi:hypothetical protein TREMEDRAFT_66231 [Tremella mesenterica DSM 1558]|uniref:uncharacterized protein n=1 Tax=Tremella mesenterica (strain ATCC 24925 / CBS 8224 / DSM 1558 / NBRC 9311 / NRRL Y-6157 / RJB 2259-6 / UBC 559-6) TaxID=578456 RepID=UPI00032C03CB|nr:uncharacterized protein TREMEDRAFT_66231 [Tremella mesenterica DSM 1558]EIW65863.1 hypothetical protein TREMEDRAFT_66231 [Tremella mesenterica DSM 1558]